MIDEAGNPGPDAPPPGPPPSTGRGLTASFVASAGVQIINISTGVLLARSLGPTQRGTLAAALLWPTILGTIGTLGLLEASTYHVARRTAPVGTVLACGLALGALQAFIFVALGAALIPLVLGRRSDTTMVSAYIFLAYIPLNIVTLVIVGVLNGRQRYASVQSVRVLVVLFTAFLLFGVFAVGDLTVRSAVLCYLVAGVVTLVLTVGMLVRSEPMKMRFDSRLTRQLFRYGIRSHSSNVSSQFNQRLDQLLISIFLAPVKLGLYVIAVTLTALTSLVGESVTWIALPVIAAHEPGEERTMSARRFVSFTLLASALVSLPLLVLTRPVIELFFGHAYVGAANVSRLLLVGSILFATNRAQEAVLRAVGRPLDAGTAEFIALGVTVTGLAVLLPLLGLLGAAITSIVAYGVSSFWMGRRAAAALGVRARDLYVPEAGDLVLAVRAARSRLKSSADRV